MTTFIKWFLLNAVILTIAFFAEQNKLITDIIKNDLSHISIFIMGLYIIMSIYIGRLCFLADKINLKKREEATEYLLKRSEIGWFTAEHFFSLGLLGTIIGLVIATKGNLDGDLPTSEIVAGLKEGLNTAFYTTVCGIVFSLPLQVQLMILRFKLGEDDQQGI